jgi:hypothetical protein
MPYKDKAKNDACKKRYRENNRADLANKSKIRYANSREKWYDYELKKNYGVSIEEYTAKLDAQEGVCAICGGVNKNGFRLCWDHDHKTNLARGILCRRCNTLLGLCDDNTEILISMIGYLKEYE